MAARVVRFKDPNAHFRVLDVCFRVVLIDVVRQVPTIAFRLRQYVSGGVIGTARLTSSGTPYGEDFE